MTAPSVVHADRPVRLETRCARTVVVKRYLAGGAADVHSQMQSLWASPFGEGRRPPGMPRPIGVDPARQDLEMQFLPGRPVGGRGDLGRSMQLIPQVARLLADLHGSGVVVPRRRDPAALVRSARRKVDELEVAGGMKSSQAPARLVMKGLADAMPRTGELVVSHGDFSPRNVLLTPSGPALIDFDRLQMADPEWDISYWGAWTWATMLMAGQPPSWQVADDLAAQYRLLRPGAVDPAAVASPFYRVLALLRIVHGWSALRSSPVVSGQLLAEARRLLP